MFEWLNTNACPIGIDVASSGVWLVRLERGRQAGITAASHRPVISFEGATPLEQMETAADAIRRGLELGNFGRCQAVVAIPDSIVHTRTIRVPAALAMDPRLAPASVAEVRESFPFDLSEAALRVHPVGPVRGDAEVEWIAAAMRMSDVKQWLALLGRAGVRVSSLQLRAHALYAALHRRCDLLDLSKAVVRTRACLQVESSHSRVIIGRGERLTFVKDIAIGLEEIDRSIARKVAVAVDEAGKLRQRWSSTPGATESLRDPVRQAVYDAARGPLEELASQVAMCVRYHAVMFRGDGPKGLALATQAAGSDLIQSILATSVPLPVESPLEFDAEESRKMKAADRAAGWAVWATAMGLSAWSSVAAERHQAVAA